MNPLGFDRLPDLAARRLGGLVLAANDEYFAPKERLLAPEEPTFDPDRYTDRGKEMDGWETRRRRTPGHDWCVVRLGIPGIVRGAIVDTTSFLGNFPDRCSLEGTESPNDGLDDATWFELLPTSKLQGDARNAFEIVPPLRVTHVRLNIVPDGGVARLRVHGDPLPDLRDFVDVGGRADVAASLAGAVVLDASDLFFSPPTNLIAPGDSRGMHDGWETRRRRGPGHDWVVVRLAAETELERIEVDTTNFTGNHPDACSVDARRSADDGDEGWIEVLPPTELRPHARHVFDLDPAVGATHVRLNMHPDGGVARLRVRGQVTGEGWRGFGVRWLNALTTEAFEREVHACCGSSAWASALAEARPFPDFTALLETSDAVLAKLGQEDWREAFAAHPRIGERARSRWSAEEQAGVPSAAPEVVRALEDGNREFEDRFGHVFLINAAGKTADELLEALRRRMRNDPQTELREAAEQQRQITRLRFDKLVRPRRGGG